jgi:hypothetical protein
VAINIPFEDAEEEAEELQAYQFDASIIRSSFETQEIGDHTHSRE